jgi:citrate lyase subunit beta/citryl-CoA lyase
VKKGEKMARKKKTTGKAGKGAARKKAAERPARAGRPKTAAKAVPANAVIAGKAGAGRKGKDIRSDLFVSIEAKKSGGLELDIKSKVSAFYGASIRDTVSSVLRAFGVRHARVEVEDTGGLPFVIAARVETALRRAGFSGRWLPERLVKTKGPTSRDRLRRSRLYLPGNEPKFAINAGIHHPDAVILDLEDSVHPDEKDAARYLVRNALRCIDFLGAERMVRINQLPLGYKDLEEIVPESPDLILIPKVETAAQVREVDARITKIQKALGIKNPVWLMPILESALGIENAYEIAAAADTVVALTIGLEDYTADLGVPRTKQGDETLYARLRIVNAARAAGLQAIDSVFGDVGDMEGLKAWATRSKAVGFEGMGCIHPRQIRPIHECYAPTQQEIEKAMKIVAAFEEASAQGKSVVSLGSRMIDPPVVLRAQRLVSRARRMGLIVENPAPAKKDAGAKNK